MLSGALLRDYLAKISSLESCPPLHLFFMIAPLVAPVIGGYIVKYFHWHMIFYVIGIMGFLATLLVFFIIPETHKQENRIPLRLNIIARNFMMLSKQKEVLGYMAAASFWIWWFICLRHCGIDCLYRYLWYSCRSIRLFLYDQYCHYDRCILSNGKFVLKLGAETMLRIGIAVQFISGIWLFLTALFDFGFWSMAIGVAFFVGQNPLISSNATASILEKFPTMAGTANSLMGSVRFGVGAVMGSLVASFKMETAAPMLYTMAACVVISALSYYFLTYRHCNSTK